MAKKILGIDIGTHSIKVIELQKNMGGYKFTNFAYKELSFDTLDNELTKTEYISHTLSNLLKEKEIKAEHVFLTLSAHQAIIRNITLPFNDLKKIRQTIKFEFEPEIAFPIENVVVDFLLVRTAADKSDLLTVGVEKKLIGEQIEILHQAGLDPEIIDLDIFSVFNAYRTLSSFLPSVGQDDFYTALIDLGANKTTICVVKGLQIKFVGCILKGGNQITANIMQAFGIGQQEAEELKKSGTDEDRQKIENIIRTFWDNLIKDIRYSFNTFTSKNGQEEIKEIILVGGGAKSTGVCEYFSQYFAINCQVYNPAEFLPGANIESSFTDISTMFTAAIGAALHGVSRGGENNFDLRKEEFALKKEAGMAKKYLIFYSFPVGIFLFFCLFDFYYHLYLKKERYELLNSKVQKIFKETLPPNTKIVNEVAQVKSKIKEGEKKLQIFGGIIGVKLSPLEIIHEISSRISPVLKVDIRDLNISSGSIKINGRTISYDAVDTIKKDLEASQYFKEIKIIAAKALTSGTGVEFSLEITIKG